jgi:DNA-binding NtrC family response regulator
MSQRDEKPEKILVVDDDTNITSLLKRILERGGYSDVVTVDSGLKALEIVRDNKDLSVVLTDVRMPGMSGIELLEQIKRVNEALIVIIITGFGSIDQAVDCIKKGAEDFITKPFGADIVLLSLEKALNDRRLKREVTDLRISVAKSADFLDFIGISPPMQEVYDKIKAVAPTDAPVLVTGESGTGKELAVRAIHALSTRNGMPMVSVSCPNIPPQMLESELFGHVKGAFTDAYRDKKGLFEKANKGTIFLDEIGDIPLDVQAKLLRVLQESEIIPLGGESVRQLDVRVVTSTNRDLLDRVGKGLFREDLFYRIRVIHIHIPPLRDRGVDIRRLASYFLNEHAAKLSKNLGGFTPEALAALESRRWAGNVRELRNVVLQGVVFAKGDLIDAAGLVTDGAAPVAGAAGHERQGLSYKESREGVIERFEIAFIREALERSGGNISKAAREAGLSRQSFQHLMKKYGITGSQI